MSATATAPPPLMTTEEMLALPDNGVERILIRGRLKEKPMTVRNRYHTRTEATIAYLLRAWLLQQPEPRGAVHAGEVGCIIRRDPDTTFGIDVVYISADLASQEPADTTLIPGVPILAVEILSPSDKVEEIENKIDAFLAAGVALVWIVDPHFRTVTVHRPSALPEFFNTARELSGEPHLPGFRVPVAQIFAR